MLLQARFEAVGGVPFVGNGQYSKADPKSHGRVFMSWTEIIADHKRTPLWAFKADAKNPILLAPKRTARISPLTQIAIHYPMRLPRYVS